MSPLRTLTSKPEGFQTELWNSKKTNMKSSWKIIKQVWPQAKELSFQGFGHGEVMEHPDILAEEIRRFISGQPQTK